MKKSLIFQYFFFAEANKQQYLHYLPVPTIESSECNSTNHYNGQMNKDKICAGFADSDKTPCYVSICYQVYSV